MPTTKPAKTSAIRAVVRKKKAKKHSWALKQLAKVPVGSMFEFQEIDKDGIPWLFRYVKKSRRKIEWKAHGFKRVK